MQKSGIDTSQYSLEELHKIALLLHLQDNSELEIKTPEDIKESERLEEQIENLKKSLDSLSDEEQIEDLNEEIESLQEELDEINQKADINQVEYVDDHYNWLEVFKIPDFFGNGRRWAVGDDDAMDDAAHDALKDLIKIEGLSTFNSSFLQYHLDESKIEDTAREIWNDTIYGNPEDYLDDGLRQLSEKQEENIRINKNRILQLKEILENLKNITSDSEDEDEKITYLEEKIQELEDDIFDIESSPEGDFPESLIENKIDDMVSDSVDDAISFLNDMGLEIEDYVDEESLIEDAIRTDGAAHFLNSYDGTSDEVYVGDKLFYVMRID